MLFPDRIKVSRSLRKTLKKAVFKVTLDTAFGDVVEACAGPRRGGSGTWITEAMKRAYIRLYHLGFAHSVECWEAGRLVGGLYGVALGRVFCGESMFSHQPDSSKVALVYLARQLERWGYHFIDCQVYSEHLGSLGAENMSRHEFIQRLRQATHLPGQPAPWHLEDDIAL